MTEREEIIARIAEQKDLHERAAAALERLLAEIDARDKELMRIYEVTAIFYELAQQYLKQVAAKTPEEEDAVSYVRAAVNAVENGSTVEEEKLALDEEKAE